MKKDNKPFWQMNNSEIEAYLNKAIHTSLLKHRKLLKTENEKDELVTRKQVLQKFAIAPSTLYEWIKSGYLPQPIKRGRRVYFLKKQINQISERRQ